VRGGFALRNLLSVHEYIYTHCKFSGSVRGPVVRYEQLTYVMQEPLKFTSLPFCSLYRLGTTISRVCCHLSWEVNHTIVLACVSLQCGTVDAKLDSYIMPLHCFNYRPLVICNTHEFLLIPQHVQVSYYSSFVCVSFPD